MSVGPGLAQRRGHAGAHVAGADDEHAASGKRAEAVGGELDGGVADRRRAPPDRRLGAGPLAGAQGMAEQQVERRADAAAVDGGLPRRAHLAEDLALAEDQRVEPGRDLEQVGRRGVVVQGEEVRVQLVERACRPRAARNSVTSA